MQGWTFSATSMCCDVAQDRERGGIGEQRGVPLPAVPGVRALPVGVDREVIQGDAVSGELRQDRVLIVGGRVGVVLGEPVAECRFRQQRCRAGQLGQVRQGAGVVLAVAEQVAVLGIARRAVGYPAVRGPHRGLGVVEQVPAGLIEQPGGHLRDRRRAGGARLPAGARRRCGVRAVHRVVGTDVAAQRPGRQEWRGTRAGRGDGDVVDVDVAVVAALAVQATVLVPAVRVTGTVTVDQASQLPSRAA